MPNPKAPNLTIMFISVSAIVITAIGGGVYLTANGHDSGGFYGFITAALASVIGFGSLARSNAKISEQIDTVEEKVNGNMTQLIEAATGIHKDGTPTGANETVKRP